MAKLPAPGADPYTYTGHSGIDFLRGPSWLGKPFYASGPGRVVRLSRNPAGGHWIVVRYDGTTRDVGYAHMRSHAGCPAPGTRLREGMRLGYVGDQGTRVTGPHIHVEVIGMATPAAVWAIFDRNRVVGQGSPAGLGSAQRKAKAYVNRRSTPDTKHAPKKDGLKAGVVGNFTGWKHGEKVSGNDIWFRGISGDWFWSGGFTSTSTSGLANLNPAPAPSKRPTIRRGSRGNAVKLLQQTLKKNYALYAGKLVVDSIFGPKVEAAVREFQRRAGLVVDGIVGPKTWARLGL